MKGNNTMSKLWEIEDYLQSKDVFENGLNGRPCHMDSYMTVINFTNLKVALNSIPFSKDEIIDACSNWEASSYLSPIHKLLSIYVKRDLELP